MRAYGGRGGCSRPIHIPGTVQECKKNSVRRRMMSYKRLRHKIMYGSVQEVRAHPFGGAHPFARKTRKIKMRYRQ